jgi:hypothetical protein
MIWKVLQQALFPEAGEVWVVTLGIRKAGSRDDVYELARRLR